MSKPKITLITLPVDEEGNIYGIGFTSMSDFKTARLSTMITSKLCTVINEKIGEIDDKFKSQIKPFFKELNELGEE